jgi:peptidyl-prolyl cis-trans isomerase B (cyclophilin B)
MIQTGDPNSRGADHGEMLGMGGPGYTLPAEFNEKYYHKKGALAAARKGDAVNPDKESSGSQFYIVQGQVFTPEQLNAYVNMGRHKPFTQQQIDDYTTIGGTPHLDDAYTVFGEVIEGLDIIDKIASVPVDNYNRPVEDVKIISVKVLN